VPRLFIIDGSKALAKGIRRSFGRHTPISAARFIMPTSGLCRSDETNAVDMGVSAVITRHNLEFRAGHSVPVKASRIHSRGVVLFTESTTEL
jgi:hypothetical protein